jgi:putative transposase
MLLGSRGVLDRRTEADDSRRHPGNASPLYRRHRPGEWNPALAVGVTADHIHLLLSLPRTVSVAKAVQLVKSGSSKWLHESFPKLKSFAWQEGYGALSIGVSQRVATVKYIEGQAEHHKRISFEEEFKKFLTAHGIEEH